jgi:hypothetical protein
VTIELTAQQMAVLEALFAAGFRPVAIPPYENALCVRRDECAAVLAPAPNGGLRLLTSPAVLIDGHLGVKLKKAGRECFVWKSREIPATTELLARMESFERDLMNILGRVGVQ